MRRTEDPLASVGQSDLFTRLAELAGTAAAVVAFAAFFATDPRLRHLAPLFLGALLAVLGTLERRRVQRRSKKLLQRSRAGYGRLCAFLGLALLAGAIVSPEASPFGGVLACSLLICLGVRGPAARGAGSGPSAPAKVALITIGFVLLLYVSLAAAVIVNNDKSPTGDESPGGKQGRQVEPERNHEGSEEHKEPPKYADQCPALPDPFAIGHGLGELFYHDGAVKAGCGTEAFQVPGTNTWVAAGMCFGERRSVAISAPGRTAIVYGEAAEFVWSAAQEGELTAVEAATPEGGDVVMVETQLGTYGFARATRSATPGNDQAQHCNEVGGSAEPFARMPPPMVWLWVELIHAQANWFWPTADRSSTDDSVAFISPQGVATGSCASDTSCRLEFEGTVEALESPAFETLESIREYMPPEEQPGD